MSYPGYGGFGAPGMPHQGIPHGMPMNRNPMGPIRSAPMRGYSPYADAYQGANYGTPPIATNDPMRGYFSAVAGQDGEIDADELQLCLTQTGISGTYTPFSLETCKIMIAMLDQDHTGKMGFNEFKDLFTALNGWKQNFMMFDRDQSGTVEPQEMSQAINAMGYRVSPQTQNVIIKRYSKNGRVFFDDYVACCVKLRALTDAFRRRDTMQQGAANFQYDDFILCTMSI